MTGIKYCRVKVIKPYFINGLPIALRYDHVSFEVHPVEYFHDNASSILVSA